MRTSVIIPVCNGARHLAEAVASVRPELREGDEIIIVDDGSTDGTADLIGRLGTDLTVIRQSNAGSAAARNRGLRQARGEMIAFLDHDDLWHPGRQAALAAALARDAAVDIAMGRVRVRRDTAMAPQASDDPRYATSHRPWQLDAMLIRRGAFDRIGMFNAALRHAEDIDWHLRARDGGIRFCRIADIVVDYRLHVTNLSLDVAGSRNSLMDALKRALDRRRSA
jgi:glycosyltransferase involved in cell wall biosynthesis